MSRMAVTVWNYKGGVGKSTISLVLTEIGLQRGLSVSAVDLDGQLNLSDALGFVAPQFPKLTIKHKLPPVTEQLDADLYIIDTRPEMSSEVRAAVSFCDMLLVPTMGDFFSAANIGAVWQYAEELGLHRSQTAMVKNAFENTQTTREIEGALHQQGYPLAGRLPRNANLVRNIASGRPWNSNMDQRQQAPFLDLYERIWKAYERMKSGDFKKTWDR